jgi:histidinol dehydrogenase
MKIIRYPEQSTWNKLVKRSEINTKQAERLVKKIFDEVKKKGDNALIEMTERFDQVSLTSISVNLAETHEVEDTLAAAIAQAKQNIEKFHEAQRETVRKIETTRGVVCWRESRPIERVGLYIPGGSAPLFSTVLMLTIPAKIAGCREIVLCTPPDKMGKISPVILYTAKLLGLQKIFSVGGAQAIAAMSLGTESISKVDKIFGPGNQFVTAAKKYAQQLGVAIDLPAGPSELLVIGDEHADAEWVAADLLSQAEHGPDSQVMLVSDSISFIEDTLQEVKRQLPHLPRKEIAARAMQNSKAVLLKDLKSCIDFSNAYAPEHLILSIENPHAFVSYITHAGSVFLGKYSCESAGDYASGTNHTLPTHGYARSYSGVSLDSFMKKITFQELSREGILALGKTIEVMADAEQLYAHKNAVSIRLNNINHV